MCASCGLTSFHGVVCMQDVSAYNGQLRSLVAECDLPATELLQQVAAVGSALTSLTLYHYGEPLQLPYWLIHCSTCKQAYNHGRAIAVSYARASKV